MNYLNLKSFLRWQFGLVDLDNRDVHCADIFFNIFFYLIYVSYFSMKHILRERVLLQKHLGHLSLAFVPFLSCPMSYYSETSLQRQHLFP